MEKIIELYQQESNAPFVAIPWADTLRLENGNKFIPANWLQLYPVLAAFQGKHGCFLSQDKLAAYAGMRKADIMPTLSRMIERGWLVEGMFESHKTYKITDCYRPQDAAKFYMLGTELIKNGVWSAFEQTRQVIYSILQAFSKSPFFIDEYICFGGDKAYRGNFLNEYGIWGHALKNCSVLPLSKYDPEVIMQSAQTCQCYFSERTRQRQLKIFRKIDL